MEWNCKYFKKMDESFLGYGIGAYTKITEGGKDYLIITMPDKKNFKDGVFLRLHLLREGNSYNDKENIGHWQWNKNLTAVTLNGSIGDNSKTPHCWLRHGVLTLIG